MPEGWEQFDEDAGLPDEQGPERECTDEAGEAKE